MEFAVATPERRSLDVPPGRARETKQDAALRPGRGLQELRPAMESAFAHDFGAVRLHLDGVAEAHAARAVTIGDDVHLAAGERDLSSPGGKALIAHELAHVVQQRAVGASPDGTAALEREAEAAETATSAGRPALVTRATGASPAPQRKPKVAPAPPSGNILYIGMNNADPEVKALLGHYPAGSPVSVTAIKGTDEETATRVGGATFDLTTPAGIDALVKTLVADKAKQTALKKIFTSGLPWDLDDLAHVAKVYADTEADGKDRMTRVVLSGHSGGTSVTGAPGSIYFASLIELAAIFPKAANQTKHLIVAGCHTGDESTILDEYVKAFPSLLTVWAWWDACPTGPGAASALVRWAKLTEHGETELKPQSDGIAVWSGGVYHGDPAAAAPPSRVLASIRADDARFKEYFDGTHTDPSPHGYWLEAYYARVTAAARRADITGADHGEMEQNRQRALLLRFWSNVAKNFWTANAAAITKGYGSATAPNYATLSRKETLRVIADFATTAKGSDADKDAAAALLDGLKTLDPKLVPEGMIRGN